jgi:peroxiredoxin
MLATVLSISALSVNAAPLRGAEESLRRIDEVLNRRTRSAAQKERNVQSARDMVARFRAEHHNPVDQASGLLYSARCSAQMEQFALATAQAESALALPLPDKRRTEAEFLLGIGRVRSGEATAGIAVLRSVLERDVRHELVPEIRIVLAQTLADQGDGESAVVLLDSVVRARSPGWAVETARRLLPQFRMIGVPASTFTTRAFDGTEVSLADYRGKVLLLDFWATWCGPCRTTIPEILELHRKYGSQNFDVLGVSLDTNADALRAFISTYGIPWRNVFEGKGWQSDIGQRYGINAIPATFVIDREGNIRGINLHGNELESLVRRLVADHG